MNKLPVSPARAAKGIENVAAGGTNGARGQVRIAGAADVLGERPSGIIRHWFFSHFSY